MPTIPEPPDAGVAERFPAADLLRWYDRHRRTLPWRARPGEHADPYRVWLSEIMLQQTTVVAVVPYFERFVARFPTVAALAAAPADAVLAAWAGLGYYARGRNLHACAIRVAAMGGFPRSVDALEALPGIGRYTARAVGAIAFGIPAVPVDGNVERVVSRLHAVLEPVPDVRNRLGRLADELGADPEARAAPSDFAQALFDLGAVVCTPRRPACVLCPWRDGCAGRRAGIADTLPRRRAKAASPLRHGVHYWLEDGDGRVLLRRRPPSGLFASMFELPGTAWRAAPPSSAEAADAAPARADWRPAGEVSHTLTHLGLLLAVRAARVASIAPGDGVLVDRDALETVPLPTVMRRCAALGRAALDAAGSAPAGPGNAPQAR